MMTEVNASGQDIYEIVGKLEPILIAYPRGHAIIASLTVAAAMMRPGITSEQLQESIAGMSQWLCMYFAGVDGNGGEIPKELLN